MLVPQLLLQTLEELLKDGFEQFKWYLTLKVLDSCNPVPKSSLENASRTETVRKMTEGYGEEMAVNITVEILTKMNMNDLAGRLKNTYAEGKTAVASTSTSALTPPAAPATISAQQGGVIIAPTLSSGTTGSWNVTINSPSTHQK